MKISILWKGYTSVSPVVSGISLSVEVTKMLEDVFEDLDLNAKHIHTNCDEETKEEEHVFEIDRIDDSKWIELLDHLQDEDFIALFLYDESDMSRPSRYVYN
jgi:hypothetical protein